ncbi:MAG: glycosyltransferase family 2 protein [Bacteroidaceae bacterium]|nr:glycosyltransferase family 2 protein [Bacteroidaceae bacterium]
MRNKTRKLSIIIPAYNESKTIVQVLNKILSIPLYDTQNSIITKEIIIVDDCSTDNTQKKVAEFIEQRPSELIKYTKLEKNHGKGYAVRTGIHLATGDVIIIQDADLEYDPADYSNLLPFILSGEYKVVYGSRLLNRDNRYSYRSFYWGGRLVSFVTSLLFGVKITDEPTCYKMFDAAVLKSIPLASDRFGFCPEITAKVLKRGYSIKEVPIKYYPRSKKEGKKIKWRDGIEAIYILFKYRFVKN